MISQRIICLAIFWSLHTSQAMACSPAENLRDHIDVLPDCSVIVERKGEFTQEGLTAAEKISDGKVMQSFESGYGCGSTRTALIIDCERREVLGVGLGGWHVVEDANEDGNYDRPLQEFERRVKAKLSADPDALLSDLVDLVPKGLTAEPIISTRGGVRLSNGDERPRFTYNLNCGCKRLMGGS